MGLNDVINNFQLTGDVSLVALLITIALAFVLGLFIFFIYKRTFRGVIFVKSFGLSLVMLCMVTSAIILTISSNLMLSLGMVGALSIVRFRTAVKDPMDTVYMFWAIATGISLGAQLYTVAIVTSIIIGIVMIIMFSIRTKKEMPYIMVVRFDEAAKQDIQNIMRKLPKTKLKSRSVSRGVVEMTLEISLKDNELGAVDKLSEIPGVYDASIVSYNGDAIA